MTLNSQQELLDLRKICRNQADALDFVVRWKDYVHGIDDIDDGEITVPAERHGVFINGLEVYAHPFFIRHATQLKLLIVVLTADYTDSVAWQNSPEQWQREEADVLRHSGAAILRAVAYLCAEAERPGSGWAHVQAISLPIRELCYKDHHDTEGNPV